MFTFILWHVCKTNFLSAHENKIKQNTSAVSALLSQVLVEGPCTNVTRKQLNLKAIQLTQFKLKIPHSCRQKVVRSAWEKAEITKKWEETTWAKKIAARKLV